MIEDTTHHDDSTISDAEIERRLDEFEREMRRQGDRMSGAERNFSLFAAFALLLSLATLIAVAVKLQAKSSPAVSVVATTKAPPDTAAPVALPHALRERLTEMKITGSASTVAAGRVTFHVVNAGKVAHEMVVLRTPYAAGKLPTDKDGRAIEKVHVGETGDMAVGARKTLTLHLRPGHYALICNLPGHYRMGMYADLTVR